MKTFVVLSAIVACAVAAPGAVLLNHPGILAASPLAVTRTVAVAPVAALATATQYHAQDELGQFSYGYAGGPSAKAETKTADGITRGGYNYIDANGLLQSVSYTSDPVNGFRVAATNLPVAPSAGGVVPGPIPVQVGETPEVAAARANHQALWAKAAAEAAAAPDN